MLLPLRFCRGGGTVFFRRHRNYSHNAPIESANRAVIYGAGGYIHGQGGPVIRDLRYGVTAMGGVACELIAIYNALNALGYTGSISRIADYYETHPGIWLFGLWGTKSRRIPDYFRRYPGISCEQVSAGQTEAALRAGSAVIITFWNPRPPFHGIHTVMLRRAPSGGVEAYNFYNNSTAPLRFVTVEDMLNFRGKRRFIRAFAVSGV